jgi:hypothetical protein
MYSGKIAVPPGGGGIVRNSVCTPAKLPCRRVEVGYKFAIQDRVINTRNYKKTHMRFTINH